MQTWPWANFQNPSPTQLPRTQSAISLTQTNPAHCLIKIRSPAVVKGPRQHAVSWNMVKYTVLHNGSTDCTRKGLQPVNDLERHLRSRGPSVKYEFNKRNFVVRSLFYYVWLCIHRFCLVWLFCDFSDFYWVLLYDFSVLCSLHFINVLL